MKSFYTSRTTDHLGQDNLAHTMMRKTSRSPWRILVGSQDFSEHLLRMLEKLVQFWVGWNVVPRSLDVEVENSFPKSSTCLNSQDITLNTAASKQLSLLPFQPLILVSE
ncbi:hypothetical protein ILYODFUR_037015 [Ilyodon furcidens]|uniref:Uncharacterized protein n=1 Tax=Ilyodon furcidens TaxID=33524 RepID=A0ABV0UFH7_9TELE